MVRFIVALVLLGLAAVVVTVYVWPQSFVGRFVTLRDVDIEDYRYLPSRPVPALPDAAPMARADNANWMTVTPVTVGAQSLDNGAKLDAFLSAHATTAFIVVADGRVIDERYYNGYTRESLCKSFSISKSVLSALIGIANADGIISPEGRLSDYVAGIADPQLAAITIGQLLDNVSGFAYERGYMPWHDQPQMYYTTDVRRHVLSARIIRPPGTVFEAEDLSPQWLAVALEAALRKSGKAQTIADYASRRLWQPMGAEFDALWNLDRAGDGIEKSESGFVARAIDLARFGQLYLDAGAVGGKQVVPADWVAASTTAPPKGAPNLFTDGFLHKLWWGSRRVGRVREDFFANGHFGQRIYVSPDKNLVLVRMGSDRADVDWTAVLGGMADRWPTRK
jgi:CubicO group peptidase (beta-lactamase class C family)